MSEVEIRIGGRPFKVACQPGEEGYLQAAARLLDVEASALVTQLGRMPETQMLLMAGLMLADKTAGLEDRLRDAETLAEAQAARAARAEAMAGPESAAPTIEVPTIPEDLIERLSFLAEQAEALATRVEERIRS